MLQFFMDFIVAPAGAILSLAGLFFGLAFLTMCAGVVINLVGELISGLFKIDTDAKSTES